MNKKLLVACEESQRVCISFRRKGWEAYSCDILDPSGNHPEWHIKQDVLPLLNGNCSFMTMDGIEHNIEGKWDMIIAFPPCQYLTITGNAWFNIERYGEKAIQRHKDREKAVDFFLAFTRADCEKVVIENPVGYMNTHYRKPDQIIHPYYFVKDKGDIANYQKKRTCLWIKGLPPLKKTSDLPEPKPIYIGKDGRRMFYVDALAGKDKALRSKTFWSVAEAMAEQWS